ncbi:MAG: 6-phosphogluconolactonase [Bacteroidia bacterium]
MEINVYKTEDELLSAFANFFIKTVQNAIAERGAFNVVLSGGNSPKKLYELLASSSYNKKMDWKKLFFFFGDERCVPQDDNENNARMVQQALFDPLHISSNQIFKIDTSLPPHEAAAKYMHVITDHFKEREPSFDLIILGLGENSHTASLFPYYKVLTETSATVKEIFLQDENRYRITMTAPLINLAHHIAFLVYGKGKAEAVHHVLKDKTDIQKYPAQLIRSVNGDLQWFLDEASARLIKAF